MKRLIFVISMTLTLALGCLLSGCNAGGLKYQRAQGMVWNTTYHVTYDGAPQLADSVLLVLNKVGNSLNVFDSLSTVSKWNRGEIVDIDSCFLGVYSAASYVNKETNGYFDPSLAPLIDAWGFGKNHAVTSDTARVGEILEYVGFGKTHLEGTRLMKDDPRVSFNLSAIAKGYGCDKVGEMFQRNGADDYLIEIGGEIVCRGCNPQGDKWRVSVDRPIESKDSILHESQVIIEITDCGVATSGNYRNYHEIGETSFGHTISPFTGRPAETNVLSATVIAPSAMEADAFATAFMAMGDKKAKEVIIRRNIPVMLVLKDYKVWMSPAFKKHVLKQ